MTDIINSWRSNGKLLLTGEYLVLEGARALAIPLNYGQSLKVIPINENTIRWHAKTPDGLWFESTLRLPDLELISTSDIKLGNRISVILKSALKLSSGKLKGCNIITETDFDPQMGFGTSSTLISNISHWLNIDPYDLLESTFGGSGFDIACARHDRTLFYRRKGDDIEVNEVEFSPTYSDRIYFVYLGKKQVTSDGISDFLKNGKFNKRTITRISDISNGIVSAESIDEFEALLNEHEQIMAEVLKLPKVSDQYFSYLPGTAKSLGAWGGDMVLLTNHESEKDFLERLSSKGFNRVFRFNDIVK